ncbi:ABC transporter substrate-binding protein [Pseudomonas leptonychotis]|uniref:Amino acid ABC transporter substrate-binding protein n=1 Tax=Pseudomonas leptonychotis TaxID=2448482 RepID=A0A4T1ZZL4_9PSED|nr:transporter substrate-binding domain-containing protein [Pseudomonas leptonychotis]TIH10085.1 amino acid ABC transporter substrate-binding protein [Pseudomonas leptonychotis]
MNGLRACLLLWMLLVPLCGHAAQTLRLVADPWPPFNDQTLLNNGLASDLVTTALERAGYLTTYAQVPWARAVRGLQQEAYDVLINAWYTDERAVYGHYSQPYLVNRVRFLQRKNAGINFTQLSDLYPYSIAVVRDYAYSPAFGQDAKLNKVEVVSFELAARMLHARRVQLTLEDELVARFHLSRSLAGVRDQLEFLPQPLSENNLHILISRKHPQHQQIADAFNKAIEGMRADGSYAQIFQRHGL